MAQAGRSFGVQFKFCNCGHCMVPKPSFCYTPFKEAHCVLPRVVTYGHKICYVCLYCHV